jgi:molybdopterin-guanine dinucleotide biosynthesis adapter protein
MKIIAVVGTKNTGKTLLVTQIVNELVNRGFIVGTVKHVNHGFDLQGKDTWKHKEAGASLVVGANQETFFQLNDKLPLDNIIEITKNLKKLDFMVIEGFKHSKYAKVSVTDFNDEFTLKNVDPFNISPEELQSLVDLIEEKSFSMLSQMNCGDCGFEGCNDMALAIIRGEAQEMDCFMKKEKDVKLKYGGNEIPMNPFVQKFVKNTVIGMIKALKTTEEKDKPHKNIELLIRNEDNL